MSADIATSLGPSGTRTPLKARLTQTVGRGWAIRLVSLSVTFALWEWIGRDVNPIFFSYPTAILAAVPDMISSGELQAALIVSLQSLSLGFAMAAVLGILLGVMVGRYRLIDLALDSQLIALYSTPNVALVPLLILWFGLGLEAKVAVVFLSAFFPVLLNTQAGVRNVSSALVDVARVEGASERQTVLKIILPGSTPFILTGLRLAVGRAVVGMVVAEMFTAISGLGGRIIYYSGQFATDKLLVVIIVLATLGVSLTQAVGIAEKRLLPWTRAGN